MFCRDSVQPDRGRAGAHFSVHRVTFRVALDASRLEPECPHEEVVSELNPPALNLADTVCKCIQWTGYALALDPVESLLPIPRKLWITLIDSEYGLMHVAADVDRVQVNVAGDNATKLAHSRDNEATIRNGLGEINRHEIRDAHGCWVQRLFGRWIISLFLVCQPLFDALGNSTRHGLHCALCALGHVTDGICRNGNLLGCRVSRDRAHEAEHAHDATDEK